jgi:hypothetical protein
LGVIAVNVIEYLWLKDKKRPIDPTFTGLGLFRELHYLVITKPQVTESCWRSHRS